MEAIAVPDSLRWLSGSILDVDSHEAMPAQEWVRHFGPGVKALAEASANPDGVDQNTFGVPEYQGDVRPIGPDIGEVKGAGAPGAVDPKRRLDVMDALGIRRQLMFPGGVGLFGFFLLLGKRPPLVEKAGEDARTLGRRWLGLYADWAMDVARISERIRPVLPVHGDTPDELYANAKRLIDGGIRALWLPSGVLPGGRSPAHPDLDRFWALLAESGTAATLHGGAEGDFLATREWRNAEAFIKGYRSTAEFDFDPWSMSVYHWPCQNFLTTMTLGGVFERHPDLRFGVIEMGAHWVGPMVESLDYINRNVRSATAMKLRRPPSEYIKSNVRVSALYYEEVDMFIERYDLADVLCFSTDYPHVEGGKNILSKMSDRLSRLGDDVVEKFFVKNGALLFS